MRAAILILLLSVFAGCASNTDFDALKRDTELMRRDTLESKKEIDNLKEINLRVVKEDSFNALREGQAELSSRVSDLSGGMQELRGRFEESRYYQEKILKESAAERDLIKAQIAASEIQLKALKDKIASLEDSIKTLNESFKEQAETSKSVTEKPGEAQEQLKQEDQTSEPTSEKRENGDDKVKAYDAAYQLVRDKRFKEARERLTAFIKDAPGHKLAGNAQFWIAETHYAEKDYESAILAYETLLKKYPESDKTSGALLKQGYSFVEIGDPKTGKAILDKLVQKYPDSREAGLARKKISEMEKKPGRKK